MTSLTAAEINGLDPYTFMAVIGKQVIHPGGRRSTETLFRRAAFQSSHHVLDVGCGVGTTALKIAQTYGCQVTAVDISPIMLERTQANVRAAGLEGQVIVQQGDILRLDFADNRFDRIVEEAVSMFVERPRAAQELARVCAPGGMVLATEFFWRKPPTPEARTIFLGEVCPGMNFDSLDEWIQLYQEAGLTQVEVSSGPFAMMTPAGFIGDEGVMGSIQIMGRVLSHPDYLKKMAWLMPRMSKAVPYLGYVAISAVKPA